MRLLVAVSNEPLAHAIRGACLPVVMRCLWQAPVVSRSPLSPRSHLTQ